MSKMGMYEHEYVNKLHADNDQLRAFASGRGMVSEADDIGEVAVLVCGLHDRIDQLQAAKDEARKAITDLRDLARTGLPCGGYTEEQWATHRLNRIAGDLTAWLEKYLGKEQNG